MEVQRDFKCFWYGAELLEAVTTNSGETGPVVDTDALILPKAAESKDGIQWVESHMELDFLQLVDEITFEDLLNGKTPEK